MKKRIALPLIISALILIGVTLISADTGFADEGSTASWWANYAADSVLYAEVVEAPDAIYYAPDPDGLWIRVSNTFLFAEAAHVSARHLYLDRDHVIRVKIDDSGFGQILPDGHHSPYIPEPTKFYPTYIDLNFLKPLPSDSFDPITVYPDTENEDKLIVVIADAHPRIVLYEGNKIVLHVPVVLGPTPYGDYRVYRTRAADDMPGIPGVPFSNYFSGGYTIHGSPWWNWRETARGHYGSHGCVNLPDDEWYHIHMANGREIAIDEWVYRWISSNINYDEFDPSEQESRIGSSDPGWYQGTGSVRVIVEHSIEDLAQNHALPRFLGSLAAHAQVTSWQTLIDAYNALDGEWLLTNQNEDGTVESSLVRSDQSIAQIVGDTDSDIWVMLACDEPDARNDPAYPGSSRTVGQMCNHLRVERVGSICTPERVDVAFFGIRTMCDATKFNLLHIQERGELIEHERVHMIQFQGVFRDLYLEGIAIDDPTPFELDYTQLSTIGVTELMAQTKNVMSSYEEDYVFVLARPDRHGDIEVVDRWASTQEAWNHLYRECGDPNHTDAHVTKLLNDGLMGDADAYHELEQICSLPPHQLVPDRSRLAE